MGPYHRTDAQRAKDFLQSREYEEYVEGRLGVPTVTRFDSANDLDIYVPTDVGDGWYLEIKEKIQQYTKRWLLLDGVEERDIFIIDELTVRRALLKYPKVLFLIRDNVGDADGPRLFLVPLWELVVAPRARVNRVKKGKWIVDMSKWPRLADEGDIVEAAEAHLSTGMWLAPACLGYEEVPQA